MNSDYIELGNTYREYIHVHVCSFVYSLFFTILLFEETKREMREYSEVFNHYYNTEEALVIVNMKQNYFYLSSPLSKGKLMDVTPGRDEKVIFIWQKSKEMNELYKQWCERKPKNISD